MKNILVKSIFIAIIFFANAVHAQDTLKVKTSAICGTCKKTLEHDLRFEKGVEAVRLDMDSKVLTLIYNPAKTNPDKLRTAIAKTGYDADEVKADPKAYEKLEECCKKGEHQH